jgi:hypothetical protein
MKYVRSKYKQIFLWQSKKTLFKKRT